MNTTVCVVVISACSDRGLRWHTGTITLVSSLGFELWSRAPSSPVSTVAHDTHAHLQNLQINTKSMMGNYEMPHQMRQAASKSLILPVSLSLSHESFMRLDLCKSSSYLCIFSKAQPNRDFKREVCFFSSFFFYTKLVFAYIFIREIATRVSQFLSSSSTLICWIVALCSFDSISLSWYPQYPLHILF